MTEQEWLASDDPLLMLHYARGRALRKTRSGALSSQIVRKSIISDRKLELFALSCCSWNEGMPRAMITDLAYSLRDLLDNPCDACYSKSEQAALLRDIVGNPFRPGRWRDGENRLIPANKDATAFSWIDVSVLRWNDGTVRKLARAIYDERAFDRLPILADALEEAGCTNEHVLNHCRNQEATLEVEELRHPTRRVRMGQYRWQPMRGAHGRGCWVIDLLLGKE